jgi:hypothetical protein
MEGSNLAKSNRFCTAHRVRCDEWHLQLRKTLGHGMIGRWGYPGDNGWWPTWPEPLQFGRPSPDRTARGPTYCGDSRPARVPVRYWPEPRIPGNDGHYHFALSESEVQFRKRTPMRFSRERDSSCGKRGEARTSQHASPCDRCFLPLFGMENLLISYRSEPLRSR